jgi:hypothetical protein
MTRLIFIPIYIIQLTFFIAVGTLAVRHVEQAAEIKAISTMLLQMEPRELSQVRI